MLINAAKGYGFCHIYKTGGNSVRDLLQGTEYGGVHARACEGLAIARKQGVKTDGLFTFAVVRNPFDWLVSTYFFRQFFFNS